MSESNVVIYDNWGRPQAHVDLVLQTYPRMRDFYRTENRPVPDPYDVLIILAGLIVSAMNKSLIVAPTAFMTIMPPDFGDRKVASILPGVAVNDVGERTTFNLWNFCKRRNINGADGKVELPRYVQTFRPEFNFVYCDIRRKKEEGLWTFTVFTDIFDLPTWLSLGVVILSISYVLNLRVELNWGRKAFDLLLVLSALLSPGMSGTLLKKHSSSFLLALWSVTSMVIVNFYSGSITSHLISPPMDDTMSSLDEVVRQNYTFVMENKQALAFIRWTYATYPEEKFRFAPGMISYKRLIMGGIGDDDRNKILEMLAFGHKFVSVNSYALSMNILSSVKKYISEKVKGQGSKNRKVANRGCWIGKELMLPGEMFTTFLPPHHQGLDEVFNRLVESGIYGKLSAEWDGMVHSERAQDRSRVISPTQIKEDENEVESVGLEGKIAKVFCIWVLCILASGLGFICELVWNRIGPDGIVIVLTD